MENGIYKSKDATYFVKDDRILMLLLGSIYKTTKSFMLGHRVTDLTPKIVEEFDSTYSKAKS